MDGGLLKASIACYFGEPRSIPSKSNKFKFQKILKFIGKAYASDFLGLEDKLL